MLSYFAQEYGIMPSPYDSKGSEAIAPALQLVAREVGSGGGSLHQHSPQVGVGSLQAEPSCPPETMGIGRKRPLDEGTLRRFRVNQTTSNLTYQICSESQLINITPIKGYGVKPVPLIFYRTGHSLQTIRTDAPSHAL